MSITIRDILQLPSLHQAEVVGGASGLDRLVSSVSVLETVNADLIGDRAYQHDDLGGSEIVITGFLNALDDEDLQLANVRRLAESGEAGLIIYYVGVYLRRIPPAVITYADEAGFPVICMPKNQPGLRYGDAISDIMGAIIHDRDAGGSMTVSLIDAIARMPVPQRTISLMVRLLSERLHASVVLLDADFRPLYEAAWPAEYAGINQKVAGSLALPADGAPRRMPGMDDFWEQRREISAQGATFELVVVALGSPIAQDLLDQAAEAARVSINIWGSQTADAGVSELVKAILDDEPLKMRSLAALFGIDIASVHAMWVFDADGLSNAQARQLADYARVHAEIAFAGLYDGDIVLFMSALDGRDGADAICDLAEDVLPEGHLTMLFSYLETTSDVRAAFLLQRSARADARRILPGRRRYVEGDLEFAASCRKVVDAGEDAVARSLSAFDAFGSLRNTEAMIETLCAYLLDCGCSMPKAASMLSVHQNTVKYRLGVMSDRAGFEIGRMPESHALYQAAGVRRLVGAGERQLPRR